MSSILKYEVQRSFWNRILGRKKKVEKTQEEKGGHRSLKGVIVGVAVGLVLVLLNVNFMFLAVVPFIAGLVAGRAGSGAKAGILTLLMGILLLVPLVNFMLPSSAQTPSFNQSQGVGVGAFFSALGNGLGGSASAVMGGFGALLQGLGTIIFFLILIIFGIMFAIGLIASAVLGAVGGAVGKAFKRKQKVNVIINSENMKH